MTLNYHPNTMNELPAMPSGFEISSLFIKPSYTLPTLFLLDLSLCPRTQAIAL